MHGRVSPIEPRIADYAWQPELVLSATVREPRWVVDSMPKQ